MPSKEINEIIAKKMKGWDGKRSAPYPAKQTSDYQGKPTNLRLHWYAVEMDTWGKAVRRDLLVLEHHIMELRKQCNMAGTAKELFFDPPDPGDPPPAPPEQ